MGCSVAVRVLRTAAEVREWRRDAGDVGLVPTMGALRATVRGIAGDAGTPEYVSVADPATLREIERRAERAVISLACRVGRARLIDNVLLGMSLDELARL